MLYEKIQFSGKDWANWSKEKRMTSSMVDGLSDTGEECIVGRLKVAMDKI